MPDSASERLLDGLTQHAVDLERVKGGTRRKIRRILAKLENRLRIETLTADLPGVTRTAFQRKRLDKLLEEVGRVISEHYGEARRAVRGDLRDLAVAEQAAILGDINAAVGVQLAQPLIDDATLIGLADDNLILGTPAGEYWSRQRIHLKRRFADEMHLGLLRGDTNDTLARRVRNMMRVPRHAAEALTRTSVQSVAQAARVATLASHTDVVKGYVHISTLDGRTSEICMVRSQLAWDMDRKPIGHDRPFQPPPLHWNCRSQISPLLKGWDEITGISTGGRPASRDEFIARKLRERGFPQDRVAATQRSIAARLDGKPPPEIGYEAWLRSKPTDFQNRVLGTTKAKLWREDRITFADLVDETGRPLSVADLQARAARRFENADV